MFVVDDDLYCAFALRGSAVQLLLCGLFMPVKLFNAVIAMTFVRQLQCVCSPLNRICDRSYKQRVVTKAAWMLWMRSDGIEAAM